jgi:hypothetical protein
MVNKKEEKRQQDEACQNTLFNGEPPCPSRGFAPPSARSDAGADCTP